MAIHCANRPEYSGEQVLVLGVGPRVLDVSLSSESGLVLVTIENLLLKLRFGHRFRTSKRLRLPSGTDSVACA